MNGHYILDGHTPVPVDDLFAWGRWFEVDANRRVGRDEIGGVSVSTVFLGLDYGYPSRGPILFETMIFGGSHDQHQVRYATWNEAVAGHAAAVELVRSGSAA